MKNETCDRIRLLLVDYSDGVLPADQAREIAAHLAQCPACRKELRLLEHSLALAREVWNQGALTGTAPTILPSPSGTGAPVLLPSPSGRGAGGEGIAVRSGAPLTLARSGHQPKVGRERGRKLRRALAWVCSAAAACAVVVILLLARSTQPKSEIDVMEYIAREERSARLAASAQMLADRPELAQYKADAERYLKEHYAGTTAVRMLEKQQTPLQ